MLWDPLWSIAAHQGELDVHLLGWIMDLLDDLLGLGPWTIVSIIGLLLLAMPLALILFYLSQRRRAGSEPYQPTVHER